MDHMYEHLTMNLQSTHIRMYNKCVYAHVHIHVDRCIDTHVYMWCVIHTRVWILQYEDQWVNWVGWACSIWKGIGNERTRNPDLASGPDYLHPVTTRSDLSLKLSSALSAFKILHMRTSVYLGFCRSLKRFTEAIVEGEGGKQRQRQQHQKRRDIGCGCFLECLGVTGGKKAMAAFWTLLAAGWGICPLSSGDGLCWKIKHGIDSQ